MTWEGYWLPNLLQWTIGPVFTVLIGLYLKRLLRLNREQVERVVDVVETMVGGRASGIGRAARPVQSAPSQTGDPHMDLARFRKGFAAGFGVLLITLLTYATTSTEVRDMLEAILPPQLVPLVGPVLGGIALVVSVVKSRNAPEPSPYRRAATGPTAVTLPATPPPVLEQRSPLATLNESPVAAPPPAVPEPPREDPMPSGAAGGSRDLAATGLVQLMPVPRVEYR